MRSSYTKNNFGDLLKAYVMGWRPHVLIEVGVLDGYSTLAIAEGLKAIKRLHGIDVKLDAYDLFDDYEFKHGNMEEVVERLKIEGLDGFVNIRKGDAFKVWENYKDKTLDFLHIDISNTGDIVRDLIELWHPKVADRGLVLIEGGSDERDRVEWMTQYNKPPIKPEIERNQTIKDFYIYGTYFQFPSMTVLLKKWWL